MAMHPPTATAVTMEAVMETEHKETPSTSSVDAATPTSSTRAMAETGTDPTQPRHDLHPAWERAPTDREAYAAPAHDPRDIITPHAFRIAPSLLGLPLATPRQRAIAIGIDGVLVFMLAKTGGILLAVVAAVFASGWLKNRHQPRSRIGRGLGASARLLLALMIFALVVALVQPLWDRYLGDDHDAQTKDDAGELNMSGGTGLAFGASAIALQACDTADCRTAAVAAMGATLSDARGSRADKLKLMLEQIDDATADPAERSVLLVAAGEALDTDAAAAAVPDASTSDPAATAAASATPLEDPAAADRDGETEYSLLRQLLGMLDDLGLSFGWAAVYFTVFTTLWAGQTPGKKLVGIRVVHLSGRPLSYWSSFSRYGGYAAGLTTGLLGFLQVYWDPNRQAIQDQLSFTAVIRDVDLSHLQPAPTTPPPGA